VKEDLAAILGSPVWWLLFVISFFTIAAFTLRFGVAAYYFKYYADPAAVAAFSLYEGGAISAFFTLNTIASLLGVFSYSFFASRIDKKILFLVLAVAAGSSSRSASISSFPPTSQALYSRKRSSAF
jgi:GPH family glycoside/pentoside/hexuronide:cation symporter